MKKRFVCSHEHFFCVEIAIRLLIGVQKRKSLSVCEGKIRIRNETPIFSHSSLGNIHHEVQVEWLDRQARLCCSKLTFPEMPRNKKRLPRNKLISGQHRNWQIWSFENGDRTVTINLLPYNDCINNRVWLESLSWVFGRRWIEKTSSLAYFGAFRYFGAALLWSTISGTEIGPPKF